MKCMIHKNTLESHKSASGKAIYLTITYGGFNTGKKQEWFPLSQLTISEPNDCGWSELNIPDWLIDQKHIGNGAFEEAEVAE